MGRNRCGDCDPSWGKASCLTAATVSDLETTGAPTGSPPRPRAPPVAATVLDGAGAGTTAPGATAVVAPELAEAFARASALPSAPTVPAAVGATAPGSPPAPWPPAAAPGFGRVQAPTPDLPEASPPVTPSAYPAGAWAPQVPPPAYRPPHGHAPPHGGGAPRLGPTPTSPHEGKRTLLIGAGIAVAMALAVVLVLALKKPPPIDLSAYTREDGNAYVIDVSTEPLTLVSAKAQRATADEFGHAELRLPRTSIAPGSEKVEVLGELPGKRRGRTTVTINRRLEPPRLRVTAAQSEGGVAIACGGAYCTSSGSLTVRASGSLGIGLDAPPGTYVEIAGQSITVDDNESAPLVVDVRGALADVDLSVLGDAGSGERSALSLPVKLRSPDGVETTGNLELPVRSVRTLAAAVLSRVASGPVRLGDRDTSSNPSAIVTLTADGRDILEVHGRGRVRDVGLVATLAELAPRDAGMCGPYSEFAFSYGGDYAAHKLVDTEAVAYDRRTGRERGRRRFVARSSACPSSIYVVQGQQPVVTDRVDPATVTAWFLGLARQH